jgi:hypothetical protein
MNGRDGLREALVLATLVALPISTAAHEVSMALLVLWALLGDRAAGFRASAWGPVAGAAALAAVLGAWASGDVREGFGQAWVLAPLVALTQPANATTTARRTQVALGAAGLSAACAIGQAATGAEATGLLSHHLTLAYALQAPFGVAVAQRRGWLALLLAGGVLATRSDAAPIALVATAAAAWTRRPLVALTGGTVATLLALRALSDADELRQRAILWTGGLALAPGQAGAGGYAAASAGLYDRLSPGFWFPNHAHDGLIQIGATLGPAGVLAMAGLVGAGLLRGHPGPAAGLVGILVGGLTQNTLGDLEVARSSWVWLAILGTVGHDGGQSPACSPTSPASPSPGPSTRP